MKIAIIAVAYNRTESLRRLLNSLKNAYYPDGNVTLIISVDKSNTDMVERFAEKYHWPYGNKIVDKHEKNLGLRSHMLSLGKWFDSFDAIVVLEDDIIVSPNFYTYSQQAVEKYHTCPEIAGISLYAFKINYQRNKPFEPLKDEHDAYFMSCAMSWGEVWMRDSWTKFYDWYQIHQDFPEMQHLPLRICMWNHKSWLKYHTRYCIEENKFFVHPYVSLTSNFSEAGEHGDGSVKTYHQVPLQYGEKSHYLLPQYGEKAVYYDGFFENINLYKYFGLTSEELCLDLNGEWNNRLKRRYWLTTIVCDYKIVRSFGLDYRPIELNIFLNNPGNEIFLYDTQECHKNPEINQHFLFSYYYYVRNIEQLIRIVGYRNVLKVMGQMVTNKIKRFLKIKK